MTNDQIVAEIVWTAKIIRDVIGITPTLMRPPYGDIDPRVRALLRAMGLYVIIWNRDTFDWSFALSGGVASNLGAPPITSINQVPGLFQQWIAIRNGSSVISLEHDLYKVYLMN